MVSSLSSIILIMVESLAYWSQRGPLLDDNLAGGLASDRDRRLSGATSFLTSITARNDLLDERC